jgi:hypothetical protein
MVRPWEVISSFPSSYLTQSRPILFCLEPPVSSRLVWGYSTLPCFISFCLFYIYMLPWASSLLSCYFYLYFFCPFSSDTPISFESLSVWTHPTLFGLLPSVLYDPWARLPCPPVYLQSSLFASRYDSCTYCLLVNSTQKKQPPLDQPWFQVTWFWIFLISIYPNPASVDKLNRSTCQLPMRQSNIPTGEAKLYPGKLWRKRPGRADGVVYNWDDYGGLWGSWKRSGSKD